MDAELTAWRRDKRAELLARREMVLAEMRQAAVACIALALDRLVAEHRPTVVGLYWPIKSEIGLLPWARVLAGRALSQRPAAGRAPPETALAGQALAGRGAATQGSAEQGVGQDRQVGQDGQVTLSLPVIVTPRAPLEYWRWRPGEPMHPGVWNIPVPARRDVVVPDLILVPLVGFDAARYRLGYGGGYFDRTLAALPKRPFVVGVGYAFGRLPTIFPQPHDAPMDAIVTDEQGSGDP